MRLIDLSLSIGPTPSEAAPIEIRYISHEEGARILGAPIGLEPSDWPDGYAISTEMISLTSHSGTHIDAPLHYGPLCEGRPARSIEELPLSWFYAPGVLLRVDGDHARGLITIGELSGRLAELDHRLSPGEIVLVQTGADRLWGTPEYLAEFRGMSREATEWLTDQGIKVIGIDTFGFDAPFNDMLARYRETRDPLDLWPSHVFGRRREYCQIERLAHLGDLPAPLGFHVACFPVKIANAGAGWSRVVAFCED